MINFRLKITRKIGNREKTSEMSYQKDESLKSSIIKQTKNNVIRKVDKSWGEKERAWRNKS